MRQKCMLSVIALGVISLMGVPSAFADNLITNGSFETGDFTGWSLTGNFGSSQVVSGPFYAYSGAEDGNFYAALNTGSGDGASKGNVATKWNVAQGTQADVGFWLNGVGDPNSNISVYINGTLMLSLNDLNTGGTWTEFSVIAPEQTGTNTIAFTFQDDPGFMALDNVSVSPATPEPSSLLLLGSGLLTVGGAIRKKLRANR
jgi:hypothetical protein